MKNDKKIIIGNWKMNLNMQEASLYLHQLAKLIKPHRDVEVILAPTSLTLQSLSLQVDSKQFKLAAQNFYWQDSGPYTGEVSASQLRGIVQYALVGHSERRHVFDEQEKDIRNKVASAIRNNISPILCIGETAWERSNGETYDILHEQLTSGLANITSEELDQVMIAYEPVWAISIGRNAPPTNVPLTDITEIARFIRSQIDKLYGAKAAKSIKVLFGGSATKDNAAGYLSIPEINGLLVGGACLDANNFNEIVKTAHKGSALAEKD